MLILGFPYLFYTYKRLLTTSVIVYLFYSRLRTAGINLRKHKGGFINLQGTDDINSYRLWTAGLLP
jgi:hypothetical protein